MPGAGGGAGGGGGAPGGGEVGGGGQQPPANTETITNPYGDLPWSITVPANWNVEKYDYIDAYEVDVYSPDNTVLIAIIWSQSLTGNDIRSSMESGFNEYYNGYQVATDNPRGTLGNIPAETIVYSLGTGDVAVARYTNVQGYGLAVIYIINKTVASQDTIVAVDQIVQTFQIRG